MDELRSLHCLPEAGWLGGVCAGFSYWLGLPLWFVRLLTFLLIVCAGTGLVVYLLLWAFVPNAEVPADYVAKTGDTGD